MTEPEPLTEAGRTLAEWTSGGPMHSKFYQAILAIEQEAAARVAAPSEVFTCTCPHDEGTHYYVCGQECQCSVTIYPGVAAPSGGLRAAFKRSEVAAIRSLLPDDATCDHYWDGWSSDADGNDTELACKHCGAVEETEFGRVVRELAECRAAAIRALTPEASNGL